ncbi:MAG: hypothetical protein M1828_006821 [Chrysothrix sp. TS-e1954]|nr:MAG: hypothetical protein M1828_006821 [Chrysothrix sp. TS-e1954]
MTPEEQLALIETICTDSTLAPAEKLERVEAVTRGSSTVRHSDRDARPEQSEKVHLNLTPQEQLALIKQNLQEVLKPELLEEIVLKQQRPLCLYWGTATTGRPHCAYFVPMLKIASFLRAGCRVKILLADVHGFLDNLKAPIELVEHRAKYYQFVITSLLKAIGVSVERLEFSTGKTHQLTSEYFMDLLRISTLTSIHDAKKAGADVVKQIENATLSGLIYPLMQALDEEYLGVDAQFGGVDQRRIFTMAQDYLPKLGYRERIHLMNHMVPGLAGEKMSASDPDSKIDVLDNPDAVRKKIRKAWAVPKEIEENGLLAFVQYVLLPTGEVRGGKPRFVVERGEGEPLIYETVEHLHEDYKADILTPQLLKAGVTASLNELLAPVQADFRASKEWQETEQKAYPPSGPKKVKKEKDRGSRFPSREVSAKADGSVEGAEKGQVNIADSAKAALRKLSVGEKVEVNKNGTAEQLSR